MEPGISKSCRICNAIYLNEDALTELKKPHASAVKLEHRKDQESIDVDADPEASDQIGLPEEGGFEPNISLARLLFAACDVCILCGGKFVA